PCKVAAQAPPAQSSPGPLWKACASPFPTASLVLGGKKFSAAGGQTLGTSEVELGSRLPSRSMTSNPDPSAQTALTDRTANPATAQPPAAQAASAPTDRVFCMEA